MSRPEPPRPRTLTRPDDFVGAGLVAPADARALADVTARYSAAMTAHLAALVDPNDPSDPIARQFVPNVGELETAPQERLDPIGDDAHSPCEGLVHRYSDRVLLKIVSACPVYCRFCFRRETVGAAKGGMLSPQALETALAYIRARPQIWEVILTGGDPLALSPRRLADVVRAIASVGHVKTVRFHTRVPVAAPDLVTDELELSGAGAIKAEFAGTARRQRITLSGAGAFRGANLVGDSVRVSVSGAGKASVNATRVLDVAISGAGSVDYVGDPKVTRDISGVGTIKRRSAIDPAAPQRALAAGPSSPAEPDTGRSRPAQADAPAEVATAAG